MRTTRKKIPDEDDQTKVRRLLKEALRLLGEAQELIELNRKTRH